jgi:hypothetical protein
MINLRLMRDARSTVMGVRFGPNVMCLLCETVLPFKTRGSEAMQQSAASGYLSSHNEQRHSHGAQAFSSGEPRSAR